MLEVPEVNDAEVAFGSIKDILPAWEDIPEEYRKGWHRRDNKWCDIVTTLFYKGGKVTKFEPKDGVDAERAWNAVQSCLGSFEPKHEHKIAGCAYMLSEWFDELEIEAGESDEDSEST